jgi:hypothetical protein
MIDVWTVNGGRMQNGPIDSLGGGGAGIQRILKDVEGANLGGERMG